MFVAVELRATFRLGIVAVPHPNLLQPDSCVQMGQGQAHPLGTHDVITRDMDVASVNAGGDGYNAAQAIEQFGHLLESAAQ